MAPEHIALSSSSCVARPSPLHDSNHRLACLSMALLLAVLTARTAASCKAGGNTAYLFPLLNVAEPKCCFLHSWHSQLQRGAQPPPMPSRASHQILAVVIGCGPHGKWGEASTGLCCSSAFGGKVDRGHSLCLSL